MHRKSNTVPAISNNGLIRRSRAARSYRSTSSPMAVSVGGPAATGENRTRSAWPGRRSMIGSALAL